MKYSLFLPFIVAHSFLPTDRCTFMDRIMPRETPGISFREEAITNEALAQLEHYRRTGEASAVSPTYRLTALHPAVLLRDVALVEELLKKGASPNACPLLLDDEGKLVEGAPPLLLALQGMRVEPRPRLHMMEDMQKVARKLVEAGADVNARSESCGVIGYCALHQEKVEPEEWEKIALEYIRWGATPTPEDAERLVTCGWDDALEALLNAPGGEALAAELGGRMLGWAACSDFDAWEPADVISRGVIRCAQMILEANPACVDRVPEGFYERPLHRATTNESAFGREMHGPRSAYYCEFVLLLLKYGADAYLPGHEDDLTCPADHMAAQPELLAALAREGIKLPAPAHRFEKGRLYAQLYQMPPAAVRDEEVRQQWDVLATLFEGRPAFEALNKEHEDYESLEWRHYTVARLVLHLMERADAARAQEFRRTHPACAEVDAWWKHYRDNL